jgi:hypothetical protein
MQEDNLVELKKPAPNTTGDLLTEKALKSLVAMVHWDFGLQSVKPIQKHVINTAGHIKQQMY